MKSVSFLAKRHGDKKKKKNIMKYMYFVICFDDHSFEIIHLQVYLYYERDLSILLNYKKFASDIESI